MSESNTLVLTRSYLPQSVVNSQKAICMIFSNKISNVLELNEELWGIIKYDRFREFNHVVKAFGRSINDNKGDLYIYNPTVVCMNRKEIFKKADVSFTRSHVYKRDFYTCQYCGKPKNENELNYDHVIPRSQGGKTTWDNIVTCCYICNARKGNKTPEQAGMELRKRPIRPSWKDIVYHDIMSEMVYPSWKPYVGCI